MLAEAVVSPFMMMDLDYFVREHLEKLRGNDKDENTASVWLESPDLDLGLLSPTSVLPMLFVVLGITINGYGPSI